MLLASTANKPETLNGAWLIKSYLFHQSHQWRGTDNINVEWDPTSTAFPFVLNPSPSCLGGWLFGISYFQLFSYRNYIIISFHFCFSNSFTENHGLKVLPRGANNKLYIWLLLYLPAQTIIKGYVTI